MTNEQLHDFRKYIDVAINSAEEMEKNLMLNARAETFLKGFQEIRAVGNVVVKLKESKMWVGKILEARGSELPKEFQDKANN